MKRNLLKDGMGETYTYTLLLRAKLQGLFCKVVGPSQNVNTLDSAMPLQQFTQKDDHISKMNYIKDTHHGIIYNGAKIRSHLIVYT